jgi:hypothetical protein
MPQLTVFPIFLPLLLLLLPLEEQDTSYLAAFARTFNFSRIVSFMIKKV